MDAFTVVTLNSNGMRLAPKRRALFSNLRQMKADFYLLQETHSTQNEEIIWRAEWGGQAVFSHGSSNSKGVAILFDRGISPTISNTIKDDEGPFLILQVSRGEETLTLGNIYAPTNNELSNQLALLDRICRLISDLEIQNLIIGGDFNTQLDVLSSPNYTASSAKDSYTRQIGVLLDDYNLIDVWRRKHPNNKRGTFHRGAYSSRLDYIFAPEYLLPAVSSINIHPEPLSDHCVVKMELNVPSISRGPGYWKFDNTLLHDKNFVTEMTECIRIALLEDMENPNSKWEWTKYKIRQFSIEYLLKKKREQKKLIAKLEKRLQFLAENNDLSDSPNVVTEVRSIKRELSEILQEKANKAIFKAKAHWTQLGEKPSSYFLGPEKRKSKEKSITALKDDTGTILTDRSEILAYQKKYFSEIYKCNISLY